MAFDQQKMQKAYPKRVRSQNRIFYYKTGLKMRFLSKMWAQDLTKAIYIYIYIYRVIIWATFGGF